MDSGSSSSAVVVTRSKLGTHAGGDGDPHASLTSPTTCPRSRPADTGGVRRIAGYLGPGPGVGPRRRLAGVLLAAAALPAITVAAVQLRAHISFAADVPVYLFVVVLTSLVGGVVPAVLSAVAASLLLNYYFVAPLH